MLKEVWEMLKKVERGRIYYTLFFFFFLMITTTHQSLTKMHSCFWKYNLVVKKKVRHFILLHLLVYSVWICSHSFTLCQRLHTACCHSHCQTAKSARIYGDHADLSSLRPDGGAEGQQIAWGQRLSCSAGREDGGHRDTLDPLMSLEKSSMNYSFP